MKGFSAHPPNNQSIFLSMSTRSRCIGIHKIPYRMGMRFKNNFLLELILGKFSTYYLISFTDFKSSFPVKSLKKKNTDCGLENLEYSRNKKGVKLEITRIFKVKEVFTIRKVP